MPGIRLEYLAYERAAKESGKPLEDMQTWVIKHFSKPEDNKKAHLLNIFGVPHLSIGDAKMVNDLLTTKNKFMDRTGLFVQMFEDFIPSSFAFQKADDDWATKRKACAHAFFKDRLDKMLEVLKTKCNDLVEKWNTEIEANPEG